MVSQVMQSSICSKVHREVVSWATQLYICHLFESIITEVIELFNTAMPHDQIGNFTQSRSEVFMVHVMLIL